MVVIDQQTESNTEQLYGVVTVGNRWRCVVLYRIGKVTAEDIALFRVPADREDLARVLIAILEGETG